MKRVAGAATAANNSVRFQRSTGAHVTCGAITRSKLRIVQDTSPEPSLEGVQSTSSVCDKSAVCGVLPCSGQQRLRR